MRRGITTWLLLSAAAALGVRRGDVDLELSAAVSHSSSSPPPTRSMVTSKTTTWHRPERPWQTEGAPHHYRGLPVWEMWRIYGCRGIPWSCRSAARAARIRAGTLLNSSHRQKLGPRPAPRAPSSSIIHGAAVRSARRVAKGYGQGILSRHSCFHFSILSSTFWQYLTSV
jgi:hypothetical protein